MIYLLWYLSTEKQVLGCVNNLAQFILHNLNTLTTLRTFGRESLQMHFKVILADVSSHYQRAG